jgi:hypothetical protein
MPALPERCEVAFEIGTVKIFRQFDAQQNPDPNRNIRVAAKIQKQPQGVPVQQNP